MISDPQVLTKELETISIEELIKERDSLNRSIRSFEKNLDLLELGYMISPSPEVVYLYELMCLSDMHIVKR